MDLRGAHPEANVLRAAAPGVLASITTSDSLTTLRNFTLDGSAFPDGTGIRLCCGSLHLERCVVRDFTSGRASEILSSSYPDAFFCTVARNALAVQTPPPTLHSGETFFCGSMVRGDGSTRRRIPTAALRTSARSPSIPTTPTARSPTASPS